MRLIDADKLKAHYAWWNNEEKELFDQIVDAQPTVSKTETVETEKRLTELFDSSYCPQKDDYYRYDDYLDAFVEYLVCHGVRVMEVEA